MAIGEIHVNDIGTVFSLIIRDQNSDVVDISSASTKNILFEKPNGSKLTKGGSFVTDGTDGKLKYKTVDGDLDTKGTWRIQAFIAFSNTEWSSDKPCFEVLENI